MNPNIVFFGTPDIAVFVLEELTQAGIVPSLIVTNPDAPQGRKMILTPTPVAQFGEKHGIPVLKPDSLRGTEITETLQHTHAELFIVAAYGKIIPKAILDIPMHGTLNMHPSLLPKLRGASPIRSAILTNEYPTGVSIMMLTEGLDEGPILAQEVIDIPVSEWPIRGRVLDEMLARAGGRLLAKTIPHWIEGSISSQEQNAEGATYCAKITKEMGLIDLTENPLLNLRKIRAFDGWPGTYYFHESENKRTRVKICDAEITDNRLIITRVIPEGKKEMSYTDFLRGT